MSYLITLNIIIVVLSALTPFAIAQELEVFAVTREMIPDYPGSKKQKLKSEFDGIRVYLNDSTLDLTRVSTSFFNDFYIFNWRDDYNLLVERCIAKKKCDSIIVQHYEKSVKSKLLKKKSKSKYLKISEFDFGMNHSNCNDVYRFTIEKEEKNDIEYPDSTEHLDMLPQYDEKRTVVKRFYVYFCYWSLVAILIYFLSNPLRYIIAWLFSLLIITMVVILPLELTINSTTSLISAIAAAVPVFIYRKEIKLVLIGLMSGTNLILGIMILLFTLSPISFYASLSKLSSLLYLLGTAAGIYFQFKLYDKYFPSKIADIQETI